MAASNTLTCSGKNPGLYEYVVCHNFMTHARINYTKLSKNNNRVFRNGVTPWNFLYYCLYEEAIRLQCFPPTRTYGRDDHYPICSKLKYREPGCIMHMALFTGAILSFAVLHTEKFAFQCATLPSWEWDLGIMLWISVVYPGIYVGGCWTVCAQSAREKFCNHAHFIDHTQYF